ETVAAHIGSVYERLHAASQETRRKKILRDKMDPPGCTFRPNLTLYDQKTRPSQTPSPMEPLPPPPPPQPEPQPEPTSSLPPSLSPPSLLPLPPPSLSSSVPSQVDGHTPKTEEGGRVLPPPPLSLSSCDRRRDVISGLVTMSII
ncbi:unnamed protein product, partial [Laminaria digitata]